MDMTNVIGPIDFPTWYCMRQCRECITYLTPKIAKEPMYAVEVEGEKGLYKHFMDEVLGRKAA